LVRHRVESQLQHHKPSVAEQPWTLAMGPKGHVVAAPRAMASLVRVHVPET
jgi:hypothetical protein